MLNKPSKTLIETIEIARFVHRLAPKKILEELDNTDGVIYSIYRIISQSKTQLTDSGIIRELKLDQRTYQKALSLLKAKLIESILEFDLAKANYSDLAQRLFLLDLAHARLRILVRLTATYSANAEAKLWLNESEELEEWQLATSFLSPLLNWASLSGEEKEYERLCTERRRFTAIETALDDAKEARQRVVMVFAKSGAEHPELRAMIDSAIERLMPVAREHGTFRLQQSLLELRTMALQVTMNYNEALAICDETDKLLNSYPLFSNRSRRSRNALTRLMCYVQTKKYDLAGEVERASTDLFSSENQNWYTFQEWHFLLLMHTSQFEDAYTMMEDVMGRASFTSQTEVTRHRWNLFRLYAEVFTGRFVWSEKRQKPVDFQRQLLKQFQSFKSDYAGYRMAAIALEIIVNLQRNAGRLYLIERIDSLSQYKSRNLKAGQETQSNIFISLIQLLTKYEFDAPKIKKEAAPMLKRMLAIKTIDELQAQQVLPYEMLWAKTFSLLPRKKAIKSLHQRD